MSLLRGAWQNFAERLFDREVVQRLDTHERLFDETTGGLIQPVPDPHPQYQHLYNDTAWAGMSIVSGAPVILPGSVVAPFDALYLSSWNTTPDLASGTIQLSADQSGLYQFQWMTTFTVASNGGTYQFRVRVNGQDADLYATINLDSQSNSAQAIITGVFSIDVAASVVIDVELDAVSTRATTIDSCVWSLYRLFPPLVGIEVDVRVTEDGLDTRVTEDGETRVAE